jgi:outer membrane protein, heavy metal efflux system
MLQLLIAFSLAAAPPPTRLGDLLAEAHQHNPEIQAAHFQAESAEISIRPAGALENPMLMAQLWNAPADFSNVPLMLQLSETFPLGGQLGLKREIASDDARAMRAATTVQTLEIDAQVKAAYFDLFAAERQDQVDTEIVQTLKALQEAALARISSGAGQQVDALKAKGAQLQIASDQVGAEQRAVADRAQLAALLDRGPDQPFGPTATPGLLTSLPDLAQLQARALRERPELQQLAAASAQAQAQAQLAHAERIPSLGVSAAAMHTFRGQGETNFLFAGLQIDLPIFGGSKDGPRIAAAEAKAEAMRAGEKAQRNRVLAEVAIARSRVLAEQEEIELHHQLIPLNRQALQSAENGYIAGRVDFLTVFDSVRDLQMHELDLAAHLAAYAQHLAELERAVGADLGLAAASEKGHDDAH